MACPKSLEQAGVNLDAEVTGASSQHCYGQKQTQSFWRPWKKSGLPIPEAIGIGTSSRRKQLLFMLLNLAVGGAQLPDSVSAILANDITGALDLMSLLATIPNQNGALRKTTNLGSIAGVEIYGMPSGVAESHAPDATHRREAYLKGNHAIELLRAQYPKAETLFAVGMDTVVIATKPGGKPIQLGKPTELLDTYRIQQPRATEAQLVQKYVKINLPPGTVLENVTSTAGFISTLEGTANPKSYVLGTEENSLTVTVPDNETIDSLLIAGCFNTGSAAGGLFQHLYKPTNLKDLIPEESVRALFETNHGKGLNTDQTQMLNLVFLSSALGVAMWQIIPLLRKYAALDSSYRWYT